MHLPSSAAHGVLCRYARFLLLRKHHLELAHPLPPLDVTLMWATHMSVSGTYDTDCRRLFGCPFLDMPGVLEVCLAALFNLCVHVAGVARPKCVGQRIGVREAEQ